jgi:hypothetical protein
VVAGDGYVVSEHAVLVSVADLDPRTAGIFGHAPPRHTDFEIVFVLTRNLAGLAAGTQIGVKVKSKLLSHDVYTSYAFSI